MIKGKFQGQDKLLINAPHDKIWNILIDGPQLSKWMKVVKNTTSEIEHLDAVRSCKVEMNGKQGIVRERCVLFNENKEIGWQMEYDEFGFSKMFDNYSFSFELAPTNENQTLVINKGFYDAKNFFVKIMNLLVMKRMSSKMRKLALKGIKQLAES